MKEIWELVNSEGEPVGILYERGSDEPIPEGLFFRVVEVWVRIKDKLLVTQRHPSKWAGLKWEVTGGGVLVGESLADAAVRELYEETGIVAETAALVRLGRLTYSHAMIESYMLTLTEIPKLNLCYDEVVDHKFVTQAAFESMKESFNEGTWLRYSEYKNKIFE